MVSGFFIWRVLREGANTDDDSVQFKRRAKKEDEK
jgi:hypothetical protein